MRPRSVIQPLTPAIQHTRRILFEPFLLSKWLRLGFCAFLMGSSQVGGYGGGGPSLHSNSDSGETSLLDAVMPWIREHLAVILTVAAIVVAVLVVLGLLLTWLSSRAQFMLLDGVLRNRGAIVAPWREYRREGNALFRFRVVFGLISLLVWAVVLAVPVRLGIGDWRADLWGARQMLLAVYSVVALLAWILALLVISTLLMDFVVPVMYAHRLPVWKACKVVIRQVVLAHPEAVAL